MPPQISKIASLNDSRVDIFRDVRDKDLRGHDRLFMGESEQVIRRLLRSPHMLHALLLSPTRYEQLASDLAALEESVTVYIADIDLMTQIAGFHIHRGALAAGRRPHDRELSLDAALGHLRNDQPLRLIVAEGLTNVDNIGALFRNAAAFGAQGIVLDPTCCDPLYRKAIRVSMGHVLSIPYAVAQAWPEDLHRLKQEWGVTLIGAETGAMARSIHEMPQPERGAVIFGSEAFGLTDGALQACDAVCEIPMCEGVPSLNVAVSSAVFLFALSRPGGGPGGPLGSLEAAPE